MNLDVNAMGLRIYPDPILKTKAEAFSLPLPENMEAVGQKMLDIMNEHQGIGLAGPQAGLSLRVIVFDLSEDRNEPHILINPEIVYASKDKVKEEEGCLSFPEIHGYVIRHEKVKVTGYNVKGEAVEYEGEGLMAAMFQHEIDHLDGIAFVDRLGTTGKMKAKNMLEALRESYAG
jgi:peptide deformylase